MKKEFSKDELSKGIPKFEPARKKEVARDYFKLGFEKANIEADKKENEQLTQLNMMQQQMLQATTLEIQKMLAELDAKQQGLSSQLNMAAAPPIPPEMGPPANGGLPPIGPEGELMGMGGPDMMGAEGMPPDMMGMEGGGEPPIVPLA